MMTYLCLYLIIYTSMYNEVYSVKKLHQYTALTVKYKGKMNERASQMSSKDLTVTENTDNGRKLRNFKNFFDIDAINANSLIHQAFIYEYTYKLNLIHSFAACFSVCNRMSFLRVNDILSANIDEIFHVFLYFDSIEVEVRIRILDSNPLYRHLYLLYLFTTKVKNKNLRVIMNHVSDKIFDSSATLYYTPKLSYPPPMENFTYQYSLVLLFPVIPNNKPNIKWSNILMKYDVNNFITGISTHYGNTILSEFEKYDFSKRYYRVEHEDDYRKTKIELGTKYHGYNSIFLNKLCQTLNNNKIKCDYDGNIVCTDITKVDPPNCIIEKIMLNLCVNEGNFSRNSNININSTKSGVCVCPPRYKGRLCQCIYKYNFLVLGSTHNRISCFANKIINCNGGECYFIRDQKRCNCDLLDSVGKRCEFKCSEYCSTTCCFLRKLSSNTNSFDILRLNINQYQLDNGTDLLIRKKEIDAYS
ncbi:hypothetical protein HZS_7682 [Henneguya salminicola]|nr:hypothetical protein HZS_7682 [Henneguya salminicola]